METDSWANPLSSSSGRYQSESEIIFEAHELSEAEEQERRVAYSCPFCAEDFDIVGLYCHMDEEHPAAAKTGVCPVCRKKAGQDIVAHITKQHGSLFKVQRKRRHRKGGFSSTFSALRDEFKEGKHQSLYEGSPITSTSSVPESESLLSSFVFGPGLGTPVNAKLESPSGASPVNKSDEQPPESGRSNQELLVPSKDQEEQAQKSEFVRGLMFSMILDDDL